MKHPIPGPIEIVKPVEVDLSLIVAEAKPSVLEDGQISGGDKIDNNLTEEEIAALVDASLRLAPSDRVQVPSGPGGVVLEDGFSSLDSNECCGGGTVVPPDPELAAGPNHLIAVVNLAFEIYDKAGTSLAGPLTLEAFFAPLGGNCTAFAFDPNVLYDEFFDRFVIGADGNGANYCVAVSQTSDPTGAYFLYSIPTDQGGNFFDYPHAGIGLDAIYVGANLFGSGQGWVFALDKVAMYSGGAAMVAAQQLPAGHTTPQPVNLHGTVPAGPHYIVASDGFANPSDINLYTWDDPFGANNFSQVADFDLAAIHGVAVGFPVDNPQQGGPSITANDPRLLDFEYRNGFGWTTNHVACNPGGGTVNCLQYAQIDLVGSSVVDTGVVGTSGIYRYFPDLAVDACDDLVIGFTRSNSSEFPGVWVVGRENGGAFGTDLLVKAGEASYNAFSDRWGDYTGMTVDPSGAKLWYLGEYSPNNGNPSANWGTWVGKLAFGACNEIFADGFESGDTSAWSTTVP